MMMWKDTAPFYGVFVTGVGENQSTVSLPLRMNYLEALADLDAARKTNSGLDYLRNGHNFSTLASKVRPPPEPRKPK